MDIRTRRALLLSLLAERFHYSGHYERAELPALALVVASGGIKNMTPHDPNVPLSPTGSCWTGETRPGYLKGNGCSMGDLVSYLDVIDNHQVLNQTHVTVRYDFELHFDYGATSFLVNGWTTPVRPDPNADWPSIYGALPQQLGLKLTPTKADLPILVVDHIDLPTKN